MFNWFKKKASQHSLLSIKISQDGNLGIECDWPEHKSEDELLNIAKAYAGLIYMLSSGQLLSHLMHSISVNGAAKNKDDMAKVILAILEDNMHLMVNRKKPQVDIDEVFSDRS